MATAAPLSDSASHASEPLSGQDYEHDGDENDENRNEANSMSNSVRDKDRKIGHRRVDKSGIVSYKKKPTSELMAAIQLGIGQSVGGLSSKPERDVLMQDFGVVEVVFFPGEGSNLTPAHHYSDFRFKTYAPVAFRYFRDLFGIQPDDFMLSLCDEPLKELSNPGASGSIFYLTQDDEFIIKTVQHKEAEFLQKLLPGYFLNISQNKRTLLPKFYGLYCYQCSGKNIRFTVMNNLLPSTVKLHEKYDMKGSTYKRKASKHERSKSSPTLKDLDFIDNHPEGLQLEKDTYDALIKTLQRDCRVLESFKIMDYSLLVGIHNLDLANKEKKQIMEYETQLYHNTMFNKLYWQQLHQQSLQQNDQTDHLGSSMSKSDRTDSRSKDHSGRNSLHRGKSFKTRIGQYSTPMESIQGVTDLNEDLDEDEDVPSDIQTPHWLSNSHVSDCPGGIPARNAKGERLLIYLGIIDILQSFRLKKRLEHTMKSIVIDGDTISVHRPSYYAQRFLQYHATRVFKKTPTALKHSPSKKKSLVNKSKGQQSLPDQPEGGVVPVKVERSGRTISFSDEQASSGTGAVGGKPDLLPENSHMPSSQVNRSPSPRSNNVNGNSRQKKSEAFNLNTYPSEDALSAGTASTASLRGLGSGYGQRGASPPLSLSESTPTHTDFTEGTPSFTNSSPSCSSDVMGTAESRCCCITVFPNSTTSPPSSTIHTTTLPFCHLSLRQTSAAAPPPPPPPPASVGTQLAPAAVAPLSPSAFSVFLSSSPVPALSATTSPDTITIATNTTTTCVKDLGSTNPLDTVGLDSPARSPDFRPLGKRQLRAGAVSPSPLLGYTDIVVMSNAQDLQSGHTVATTSQEVKVQYSTTSTSLTSGGDNSDSTGTTSSATTVTAMTVTEVSAEVSEMKPKKTQQIVRGPVKVTHL